MIASPTAQLIAYCIAIASFSLLGGFVPNWVRMTHTRMQVIMSFVSGLMLGVAFYHLLPHSIIWVGGPAAADVSVWWLMIGLIVMLLLLRMFHFHQHDFSDDDNDQQCDHQHHGEQVSAHRLSWVGISLGLGLHTIIDGVALGAVIQGESFNGQVTGLLGVGVFLAILLHKPLDALSITAVMEAGGWSRSSRTLANVIFSLMCPLGAFFFYFGVDQLIDSRDYVVGAALAFSAGAFICIALSDLLPEVQFHSHDRLKLTVAFLLGIILAHAIGGVEPDDVHGAAQSTAEQSLWVKRIIYPPIWLVFGLIVIFALNELMPEFRFSGWVAQGGGGFIILLGLILLLLAGSLFKRAGTDLIPFKTVSALVTTGIYRYTRNPMYLGMAAILLGCGITVGSTLALLVTPAFMLIIQLRFIRAEEKMLRALFPQDFPGYCSRVRRWL